MNGHCRCEITSCVDGWQANTAWATTASKPQSPTLMRRGLAFSQWLVPSVILALLPKCPACLAAYLAMGTGAGLSLSTATHMRSLLVISCVAVLSHLVARRMCHLIAH